MMKPEEWPEDAAESNRAGQEPSCLWHSYQAHKKQTEHNNQTDRVTGEKADAVTSERNNRESVRLRRVRGGSVNGNSFSH